MVLAVSWQPAFCENARRRPECRSQHKKRYDASHFSLHGLWPQPGTNVYCNVDPAERAKDKRSRWRSLAPLGLSKELQRKLWKIMPGVRSSLHRHEWVKHGTCYSRTPEKYYRDSLVLMDKLNASPVQELFENSVGDFLSTAEIRKRFDAAFGRGAGKRVRVACRRDGRRELITELTIGLAGTITADTNLGALILNARPTRSGCPGGIVDPAGFQ